MNGIIHLLCSLIVFLTMTISAQARSNSNWFVQDGMGFCATGEVIFAMNDSEEAQAWAAALDPMRFSIKKQNGFLWIAENKWLLTSSAICEPYSKVSDAIKGSVVAMTLARAILPYTGYAALSVHVALGAATGATVVFLVDKFCEDYFQNKSFEKTLAKLRENGCKMIEIQSNGEAACRTTPAKDFVYLQDVPKDICPIRTEK